MFNRFNKTAERLVTEGEAARASGCAHAPVRVCPCVCVFGGNGILHVNNKLPLFKRRKIKAIAEHASEIIGIGPSQATAAPADQNDPGGWMDASGPQLLKDRHGQQGAQ